MALFIPTPNWLLRGDIGTVILYVEDTGEVLVSRATLPIRFRNDIVTKTTGGSTERVLARHREARPVFVQEGDLHVLENWADDVGKAVTKVRAAFVNMGNGRSEIWLEDTPVIVTSTPPNRNGLHGLRLLLSSKKLRPAIKNNSSLLMNQPLGPDGASSTGWRKAGSGPHADMKYDPEDGMYLVKTVADETAVLFTDLILPFQDGNLYFGATITGVSGNFNERVVQAIPLNLGEPGVVAWGSEVNIGSKVTEDITGTGRCELKVPYPSDAWAMRLAFYLESDAQIAQMIVARVGLFPTNKVVTTIENTVPGFGLDGSEDGSNVFLDSSVPSLLTDQTTYWDLLLPDEAIIEEGSDDGFTHTVAIDNDYTAPGE